MQNWGNCVVIYCCVISRLEMFGPLTFKGLNAFQGQGCMWISCFLHVQKPRPWILYNFRIYTHESRGQPNFNLHKNPRKLLLYRYLMLVFAFSNIGF